MTEQRHPFPRRRPQATAQKVREQAFLYKTNFYELPTRDELVEMLEDCAAKLAEYEAKEPRDASTADFHGYMT